jgi:heme/copper-type cytochrome/quinol oxidase subunit 4
MSFYATASLCTKKVPSGALFRHPAGGGNHHRRPSSSSRRSPWWGGSSSPSGLRVCTSSYVFDLSLSRVLDMARSWCIARFVNIVGSYGVSSISIFVVMNRIFSLWGFVIVGLNIQIWEHLMYVLHMNTRGDNGVLYWFTWCMFWHLTRGFPMWHWGNLCIGVDACFHYLFSDRNFGVLLGVLCVDWILWL